MRGVWSDDANLNDDELERQYEEYQSRICDIKELQLVLSDREGTYTHLDSVLQPLNVDLDFIHKGWYPCMYVIDKHLIFI